MAWERLAPVTPIAEWTLAPNAGRAYARVAGDWNPIHLSGALARPFGFRSAILHGSGIRIVVRRAVRLGGGAVAGRRAISVAATRIIATAGVEFLVGRVAGREVGEVLNRRIQRPVSVCRKLAVGEGLLLDVVVRPGAPAFIFVAERWQAAAEQPLFGWMGHDAPFAFDLTYAAGRGIERMRRRM